MLGASPALEVHEALAERFFRAAMRNGTYVGQLRTQLGVLQMTTQGPELAARELLDRFGSRGTADVPSVG